MPTHNLLQVFDKTVRERGQHTCLRFKEQNRWHTLSWNEVAKKVFDLAGGLKKLGVRKGDRVCIFSKTRPEWTLADLAILSAGGITVPIYESSIPEQAHYILENCEAKAVFIEDDHQYAKISSFHSRLPHLKQVIFFDKEGDAKLDPGHYTFEAALLLGAGEGKALFDSMAREITPETDATYVYTSGTTGPPKGAVITHGNILSEITGLYERLQFTPQIESLLFLPLAHILARVVQFAQMQIGFVQCYAESIDKLLDNIAEVKPHMMASVPRIFEKVHSRVMQGVESSSASKKQIFEWAMLVGKERSRYILEGKPIPTSIRLKWPLAFRLVFSKLHQRLGGRIQFFISGGAPLPREIAEFFHAAGFLILEGYGLTETSAAISVNTPEAFQIGSVGKALPGAEIKIAGDGEILVRGPMVFKGYYKRPEDTREALNAEGWFHTGDIGVIDPAGFVKITDRKKDIIVTAAGKNVAPQNIENLIKTDPLISQVVVHGDRRKYLSALVTLDKQEVINYARHNKIIFQQYADLVRNEKINLLIKNRIDEKNKQLAKYETIKKFVILENDFSVETGELTPTMKVKRRFTSEKYKDLLDNLYQD